MKNFPISLIVYPYGFTNVAYELQNKLPGSSVVTDYNLLIANVAKLRDNILILDNFNLFMAFLSYESIRKLISRNQIVVLLTFGADVSLYNQFELEFPDTPVFYYGADSVFPIVLQNIDVFMTQDQASSCMRDMIVFEEQYMKQRKCNMYVMNNHIISPKFEAILVNINSARTKRHIIFTHFKGKYGVTSLQTMLFQRQIVSSIYPEMSANVVLTSVIPRDIKGIQVLHILDSAISNSFSLFDAVFDGSLEVNYYVSKFPVSGIEDEAEIKTPDQKEYDNFMKIYEDRFNLYDKFRRYARRLLI